MTQSSSTRPADLDIAAGSDEAIRLVLDIDESAIGFLLSRAERDTFDGLDFVAKPAVPKRREARIKLINIMEAADDFPYFATIPNA